MEPVDIKERPHPKRSKLRRQATTEDELKKDIERLKEDEANFVKQSPNDNSNSINMKKDEENREKGKVVCQSVIS